MRTLLNFPATHWVGYIGGGLRSWLPEPGRGEKAQKFPDNFFVINKICNPCCAAAAIAENPNNFVIIAKLMINFKF